MLATAAIVLAFAVAVVAGAALLAWLHRNFGG
jgi:cobalamin synthase